MDSGNFKTYDPITTLIATSGSGGSGGLPLTGGVLTGNLLMQAPAKIVQTQTPTNTSDLINKGFADGSYQAKKPSAVPNNVALFGTGVDAGQTVDSGFKIDANPLSLAANDTLWSSNRLIGSFQYGAVVYKATGSLAIPRNNTVLAFSAGNALVGPGDWPNIGSTITMNDMGIASITNSLPYATYFKLEFVACSLTGSSPLNSVECAFQDETTPIATNFGINKTLNCLLGPPTICNNVHLIAMVGVAPGNSFEFSVYLTNLGEDQVTVDPDSPTDGCLLVIQRVA